MQDIVQFLKERYPQYIGIVPTVCECGAAIVITEGLQIKCSNPGCSDRLAKRLEKMVKDFGCVQIGEMTCYKLSKQVTNIWEIYDILQKDFPGSAQAYNELHAKRTMPLWRLAKGMSMTGIDHSAKKLFNGYISFVDFMNDLRGATDPLAWITMKLGYKSVGEAAVKVGNALVFHEAELTQMEQYFTIVAPATNQTLIAISGDIDGYPDKQAFIDMLNEHLSDGEYVLNSSVSKQCAFLITDLTQSGNIDKATKYGLPIFGSRQVMANLGIS